MATKLKDDLAVYPGMYHWNVLPGLPPATNAACDEFYQAIPRDSTAIDAVVRRPGYEAQ